MCSPCFTEETISHAESTFSRIYGNDIEKNRFGVFHDVVLVAILTSAIILVISILGLLMVEGYGDTTDNKLANKVF